MIKLKTVNDAVKHLGVELVQGEGYFYFIPVNDDFEHVYFNEYSVMVYRLNQLTLEQWLEEAKAAVQKFIDDQDEPEWFIYGNSHQCDYQL